MTVDMLDVMLAEDEEVWRNGASRYFRPRVRCVNTTDNGDDALVLGKDCDVAVLDIDLPGPTGLEVAEILGHDAPHVYRIVVSGIPSCVEEAERRDTVYETFLRKPLTMNSLLEVMQKDEVLKRMPTSRAVKKIRWRLRQLLQGLDRTNGRERLPAELKSSTEFAKQCVWYADFDTDVQRGAVFLVSALRGMRFIPTSGTEKGALVKPTKERVEGTIELIDAILVQDPRRISAALSTLADRGVPIFPDFGSDYEEYARLAGIE